LFLKRERTRMKRHLKLAFPELDSVQRRRIQRGCANHLGCQLAEVAWLARAGADDVKRICEVDGFEHVDAALEGGRGLIFATAHCGNWEILAARVPVEGYQLLAAVRELDDPRIDRVVTDMRSRFGTEIVPRGPAAGRQLARALAKNKSVGLLIDQDIPSIPGVFVPFFGRSAWTPSGAAMLALRMRCPLLPAFIHRKPDGTHKIHIKPPLAVPSDGTLEDRVRELTAAATAAIEWQIRAWPEQWVWMHRRWRTRPEGEESEPTGEPPAVEHEP
jgi:KDO2-lipid IV(A) lauroyltransferase